MSLSCLDVHFNKCPPPVPHLRNELKLPGHCWNIKETKEKGIHSYCSFLSLFSKVFFTFTKYTSKVTANFITTLLYVGHLTFLTFLHISLTCTLAKTLRQIKEGGTDFLGDSLIYSHLCPVQDFYRLLTITLGNKTGAEGRFLSLQNSTANFFFQFGWTFWYLFVHPHLELRFK